MWRLCSKIYFIRNSFWKFYELRSERWDFNSCGKWSSRVLPVMLWWFPYFYSDCSWPYCASLHKWYDIWVFLGTCWMQLSNPLVGGRSFPKVVSATKWAGVFHVERSLAQFNSSWALNIRLTTQLLQSNSRSSFDLSVFAFRKVRNVLTFRILVKCVC